MEQKIKFTYINPRHNIGLINWRQVYLLHPQIQTLIPEVNKGRLMYRVKGSTKRISYAQIKKGLQKKDYWIKEEVPSWLDQLSLYCTLKTKKFYKLTTYKTFSELLYLRGCNLLAAGK